MKTKAFLIFLVAGCAFAASQSANAWVESVGKGKARDCFLAAFTHAPPQMGIAICDKALAEETLDNWDRASTLVNRGALKFAGGQNTEAMADFDAAVKIAPDHGDAYVNRGVLLLALNRYDEALAEINKGMGMTLSHPDLGFYDRALAEDLMGRYQEAYNDYKHALELEPDLTKASERLKQFIVTTTPGSPT